MIEKGYYKQSEHKMELLLYGIMIQNNIDDRIKFNYPIFPKILLILSSNKFSSIYWRDEFKWYDNEDIIDIIVKSHLGGG